MRLLVVVPLLARAALAAHHEGIRNIQPDFQVVLGTQQSETTSISPSHNEAILLDSFDNIAIDQWSYYYTHGLHLAGTNESQAQWTADKFAEFGWTVSPLVKYYTYLNYPVSQALAINHPNGTTMELNIQEAVLSEDSTTGYPNRVPVFHGYSFSGNATAEFVYVGRGQELDFQRLVALGVPLQGKIALARYGGPFRGLKVKNAQTYGMIGTVIFTDTGDDDDITEANGYAAYPLGPARNPTAVQRGSVQFLSTYPGDPTTPGYPSKEGSPRTNISAVTPLIPSLPISWTNGQTLMKLLDGHGTPGADVGRPSWVGAFNASYSTGPAPGTTLSLSNQMKSNITWIWDAIGYINGTDYPDEVVIVGNHRDAWILGGASDPNSGSACMIELSKAFGRLLATGWRPKRTIVLASWDAEEYGLLGSTEWVEEYLPWLNATNVAYLNIDTATKGPDPDLTATPDLHQLAIETMKKVPYPNYHNQTGLSLYDVWYSVSNGSVAVLGSGSDYTAFVHTVGSSALNVDSGRGTTDPVYHYHSNYDSHYWMSTFGDPGFKVHQTMGSYLTLLAYNLASRDIIPLDVTNYGVQMTDYYNTLSTMVNTAVATVRLSESFDLSPVSKAIATFNASAAAMSALIATNPTDVATIRRINAKLRDYQRGFISQGGLPGREFYKHVVFAPGLDTGYAPVTFPGITEQVERSQWTLAREWIGKTSRAIEAAARILEP